MFTTDGDVAKNIRTLYDIYQSTCSLIIKHNETTMTGQKNTPYALKKDKYTNARSGNSHFLDLCCSRCGEYIALYQKDGQGSLIRLYLDRIFNPKELSELQFKITRKKDMPNLKCSNCGLLIGAPMEYKPERRLAFRLIRGSFVKERNRELTLNLDKIKNLKT